MGLLVANVPLRGDVDARIAVAARLGVPESDIIDVVLIKRSLDARQREKKWVAVYRVEVHHEAAVLGRHPAGVRRWTARDEGRYGLDAQKPTPRTFDSQTRPIVVGAGPAGMFAAIYLAEAGARVTLLERGAAVEPRISAVNGFWRGRAQLDPENNLLFGEGGAGTFSDGKIYTRRRDGELGYIFAKLVEFGADPRVLQEAWAHLGTDRIRALLVPFRTRLQELGVDVRFGAQVTRLLVNNGACTGVELADGSRLDGAPVLMATGHSARDAIEMMVDAGAAANPRGIAVGVRVEHPQEMVDVARYGPAGREGNLPPASYRLAHHPDSGPAARTFCMCPGGMVVPASNHAERVVVNGMSFAARRAYWANSAVIVEVDATAFGSDDPMAGFRWQDAIERRAFELGGQTYAAPAQRVIDFLSGTASASLPRTSYPFGIVPVSMQEVLPGAVLEPMREALRGFDRRIRGFAGPEGVLIAPETRTTSPVRFRRDDDGQSVSLPGLYPVGEGAGYAGGIISSALDGLRAARAIAT